jgi:hypothetical protein
MKQEVGMSASNRNSIAGTTVFHPLGAIRLTSPAEEKAARRSSTGTSMSHGITPSPRVRAVDVLRAFARVWVEAQVHRNGF